MPRESRIIGKLMYLISSYTPHYNPPQAIFTDLYPKTTPVTRRNPYWNTLLCQANLAADMFILSFVYSKSHTLILP